ncbi:FUS3-complementing gene 1 [Striga asiatica]|uniref:FUS3-complementing gene 1 n=1 Tax=Striga asiatica TaxID=4170 RepID=A0A5A7PIN9_STRAF|nr:FUS3-complementing gene 1 [Striga asiatica]
MRLTEKVQSLGIITLYNTRPFSGRFHPRAKASSLRDADSGPKASSLRDADSGLKASSSRDVADCGPRACFPGTFPELLSPMDSTIPRRALGKPAVKERVGRYAKCLPVDPTRPDALVGLEQVSNLVSHDLGGPTCVSSRPTHAQATLKHASLAG